MRGKMGADRRAVERADGERHMIHVARVPARDRTAASADDAIHRHEIDQARARAELPQPDIVLLALEREAEHALIKARARGTSATRRTM